MTKARCNNCRVVEHCDSGEVRIVMINVVWIVNAMQREGKDLKRFLASFTKVCAGVTDSGVVRKYYEISIVLINVPFVRG